MKLKTKPSNSTKATSKNIDKIRDHYDRTKDIGGSNWRAQHSALGYWNAVLDCVLPETVPCRTWPEMIKVEGSDPFLYVLKKDTWGKLADHLMRYGKGRGGKSMSWNTVIGYLSKVKNVIINDISDTNNLEWIQRTSALFGAERTGMFSKLNRQITNTMMRDCSDEGTELVNAAPYMTKKDQKQFCEELFARDNPQSHADRTLLILQRHTVGRISEIAVLRPSQISLMNCNVFTD
jgi:hypothetical protein